MLKINYKIKHNIEINISYIINRIQIYVYYNILFHNFTYFLEF